MELNETKEAVESEQTEDGVRIYIMYCSHCQKEFRQPVGPRERKCPYCGKSDAIRFRGIA
ncbi:MAG: hypothetical protein IJ201_01075 [Solobacterium sp.]|nr:hypothetical protein [Solobacterium sp.]